MRTPSWTRVVCVVALVLLVGAQAGTQAPAQGLGRLRAKLRRTLSRTEQVEAQLKNLKAEEATARYALSRAQRELEEARGRLGAARRRLRQIESDLRQVKAEKAKTEAQLANHSDAMAGRLLAMYRQGTPSYLEVVLNATDFDDFANRAETTRLLARQDQKLLLELVESKRKLAAQKALIEDRRQEQVRLLGQIRRETAVVDERRREAGALAQKARQDRAAAEAEYAALREAARDMAALIRSVQSGRGGRRYAGEFSGHFLTPVRGPITSPFGWRIHPVWRDRRFHDAVDIAADPGTPIKAADKGLVVHSGMWGAYGYCVIIDHGSGWATRYGHCSSLLVSTGDVVTRGQTIGRVGSTGTSTGPHLDWAVLKDGVAVDPLGL